MRSLLKAGILWNKDGMIIEIPGEKDEFARYWTNLLSLTNTYC